jgi:hypothetical protein
MNWKGTDVAWSKYYPSIGLEGLRKQQKTSVRIARVPDENQIQNLSNTSLEHYHYTRLLGTYVYSLRLMISFSLHGIGNEAVLMSHTYSTFSEVFLWLNFLVVYTVVSFSILLFVILSK